MSIEQAAFNVISEIVDNVFEYCDSDENADHMRLVTLGEIQGVIKFVEDVKKMTNLNCGELK